MKSPSKKTPHRQPASDNPAVHHETDGSMLLHIGVINPFKRAKFALKRTLKINPRTTGLVLLFNLTLLFVSAAVTISIAFAVAGRIVAAYIQGTSAASILNSLDSSTATLIVLTAFVGGLVLWLVSLFMTTLSMKVALASAAGEKIGFRRTFKDSLRILPRILLASVLISFASTLLLGAYLASMLVLSNLSAVAPSFIIGTVATLGFMTLFAYIAMRFFIYVYFLLIDGQRSVVRAFKLSKDYYASAPGYTLAVLLIALSIVFAADIIGSLLTLASGTMFFEAIMTMFTLLLFVIVLAVAYIDIKAARAQPLNLKASRGSIALSSMVLLILFITAVVITPRSPATSPLIQGTGFPSDYRYIEEKSE